MHYDEYVRERRPLLSTVDRISAISALLGVAAAIVSMYAGEMIAGATYLLGAFTIAMAFSPVPGWLGRTVVRHTGTAAMLILVLWLAAMTWTAIGYGEVNAAWYGLFACADVGLTMWLHRKEPGR